MTYILSINGGQPFECSSAVIEQPPPDSTHEHGRAVSASITFDLDQEAARILNELTEGNRRAAAEAAKVISAIFPTVLAKRRRVERM